MTAFSVFNILDFAEQAGVENLQEILKSFSCERNSEVQTFINEKAYEFAIRKLSATYIVYAGDIFAGIFSLTHKALEIPKQELSTTTIKRLQKVVQSESDSFTLSAFLIAQLGKNDTGKGFITGNELLDVAWKKLSDIQREISGNIVYLECEDNEKLLNFYQNEHNCFRRFSERYSTKEQKKYIQLLKFL